MASIETNLNQSPYFDDFNEEKNFHRVLFRPGYAVQARELTQLQTILQNQVERFGDEILTNGTVVSGCDVELQKWNYVKLFDRNSNTDVLTLTQFFNEGGQVANATITGSDTGVTAKLLYAAEGSESAAPNYLTAFVSYTNSGTDKETKTFADNEVLLFRDSVTDSFLFAANTIASEATGLGLGAASTEGVVYHKGHFIRSEEQVGIVSKYTTAPTKRVGFETVESIVDSNQDASLLDNASGSTNHTAPGAARLKISTKLTSRDIVSANTTDFFVIADVQDGRVLRDYSDTNYGDLEDEMARRTFEESGNYALNPFVVTVQEHSRTSVNGGVYGSSGSDETGDSDKLVVEVSPSVGYIKGYRTELVNTSRTSISKAKSTATKTAVNVGQSIGNHIICENVFGTFGSKEFDLVSIRDAAQSTSTGSADNSPEGNEIGTARVRGFEYHSTGKYRIYLYDIKMTGGNSFQGNARSLYVENSIGTNLDSYANIVQENGESKLKDTALLNLVYPLQSTGVKTLSAAQYVYRDERDISILSSTGVATVNIGTSFGGSHSFNDTGSLSSTDAQNIIVVLKSADGSYKAGQIWDWAANGGSVSATGSTMTLTFGSDPTNTFSSDVQATVYFNVLRSGSSPQDKIARKSRYIHIDTSSGGGANGPWELGVPDAFKLEGVYKSTSGNGVIANKGENVTSQFNLDTGQRDAFYDGARLFKNSGSQLDTTNQHFLVEFSYFETDRTDGLGYYTVDSYPVDDTSSASADEITTQEIPLFTRSSGGIIDLRDAVDFRPIKSAASGYTPVASGTAPTNPPALTNFDIHTDGSFFPTPDENFQADIERYLPRVDLVSIKSDSTIVVTQGASEDNPVAPLPDPNNMLLAQIYIPPYPSLSPIAASFYARPRYEVIVDRKDNKRLTMEDLRKIDNEVKVHREWIYLNHKEITALTKSVKLAGDPVDIAEPPKTALIVDPPADPVIENTLRSSDLSFSKNPLRVIPTLQDVELKLQDNPTNTLTSNTIITLESTGYASLVEQEFATQKKKIVVNSSSPAKLYNGQMVSSHPVCTLEQEVDTIVVNKPAPDISGTPVTTISGNYSVGGYGVGVNYSLGNFDFGF